MNLINRRVRTSAQSARRSEPILHRILASVRLASSMHKLMNSCSKLNLSLNVGSKAKLLAHLRVTGPHCGSKELVGLGHMGPWPHEAVALSRCSACVSQCLSSWKCCLTYAFCREQRWGGQWGACFTIGIGLTAASPQAVSCQCACVVAQSTVSRLSAQILSWCPTSFWVGASCSPSDSSGTGSTCASQNNNGEISLQLVEPCSTCSTPVASI